MSWPHPVAQTLVAAMATLLHLRNSSSFGALWVFLVCCSQISKAPTGFWLFQPWEFDVPAKGGLRKWASHARMTLLQKKTNYSVLLLRDMPTHSLFFLLYTQSSQHLVPISLCCFVFLVFLIWECSFAAQPWFLCWAVGGQGGISTNFCITKDNLCQLASVASTLPPQGSCEGIWGDFFLLRGKLRFLLGT